MASISRRFLLLSWRCPSRTPSHCAPPKYTSQWPRPLSTTPSRRANETPQEGSVTAAAAESPAKKPARTPQSDAAATLRKIVEDLKGLDPEVVEDAIRKGKQGIPWSSEADKLETEEDFEIPEENTRRVGFWGEGEEKLGADEDYFGDDLTSLGHGELEQHRELREYARLIAWELPLLSQLARPFEPPTAATPFRFRYTSYLGEKHPATNKVVVEFCASDMNLNETQTSKLIKLAGVRYNPDTDIIKMSCEDFDTQAQNKRFLGETISKLLKEAKDSKDTFADVPFDFRHHKPKVMHEFPKEWILTPERKQYLESKRAQSLHQDDRKLNNGQLIDGASIIGSTLPVKTLEPEPVPAGGARGRALR